MDARLVRLKQLILAKLILTVFVWGLPSLLVIDEVIDIYEH